MFSVPLLISLSTYLPEGKTCDQPCLFVLMQSFFKVSPDFHVDGSSRSCKWA